MPFVRQPDPCTYWNTHPPSLDPVSGQHAGIPIILVGNQIADSARFSDGSNWAVVTRRSAVSACTWSG